MPASAQKRQTICFEFSSGSTTGSAKQSTTTQHNTTQHNTTQHSPTVSTTPLIFNTTLDQVVTVAEAAETAIAELGTLGMSREVVARFWMHIIDREWEQAHALLDSDFYVNWPHSREMVLGAKNYIDLNRSYPEPWTLELLQCDETLEGVVVSQLFAQSGGIGSYCCAFYNVAGERILHGKEYWLDCDQEQPGWRKQFVTYY